jgi:hypothetical protein
MRHLHRDPSIGPHSRPDSGFFAPRIRLCSHLVQYRRRLVQVNAGSYFKEGVETEEEPGLRPAGEAADAATVRESLSPASPAW